ncbi:MAG: hypothetical protein J7M38_12190, partial [Armatimonadetes bacterium]|nr:hypothetical protein [Armatimonadota bacterium]
STGEEEHVVADKVGLTTVILSESAGDYRVERGAQLSLTSRADALAWVGQGSPELLPQAPAEQFPCVLVVPDEMKQPFNTGGNRVFQQEYSYRLYYVREYVEGHAANIETLQGAGELFNLLMSDTYLGGTCWHSQVTAVNPEPAVQERLREMERPLRVVELQLVAKRAEVWKR